MGPVAFLVNKQLLRHTWRISDKSTKGGEVSGMSVPLSTWAPQGAKWWKKGRQMSIGYTRYVLCTYTHMIYTYMYGASGYICIRRPRQTQGGARQGIRHFPLVASGSSSVRHFYIYIYIRRPRQTQGGARQGIIHLAAFVHHAASAQHSSRKAMFDTVFLRFQTTWTTC